MTAGPLDREYGDAVTHGLYAAIWSAPHDDTGPRRPPVIAIGVLLADKFDMSIGAERIEAKQVANGFDRQSGLQARQFPEIE